MVLGAWCVLTLGGAPARGQLFLPSPARVIQVTLQLLIDGSLGDAILVSSVRIAISFAAACAVALPLGIFMGSFDPVERFFNPIMAPLRYMPISAFIPLLILWFGIDEGQKIAFLFLGVFVYLLPVVVTAIRAVPDELVQTALTLGATRAQVIRTVLIPAALPEIFDSFRVMNAISWTYVILAEFVNARTRPRLPHRARRQPPEDRRGLLRDPRHRRHRARDRRPDSRSRTAGSSRGARCAMSDVAEPSVASDAPRRRRARPSPPTCRSSSCAISASPIARAAATTSRPCAT